MDLTDHQWQLIQPLLPPPTTARGRPSYPGRLLLDAIFWKVRSGLPWYHLPDRYPAWQTCYYHYRLLRDAGLLDQIYAVLAQDLFPRLDLDIDAILELNLIGVYRRGSRHYLRVNLEEDGAWQTSTLLLLLRVLAQKAVSLLAHRRSPPLGSHSQDICIKN